MLKNSITRLMTLIVLLNLSLLFADDLPQIESWITNPDRSALFEKKEIISFTSETRGRGTAIIVDDRQQFQTLDGFGFALTGGSAEHIINMSLEARAALLQELFGTDGAGIGVSYLRVSIGASDLNSYVFSYDDLPAG